MRILTAVAYHGVEIGGHSQFPRSMQSPVVAGGGRYAWTFGAYMKMILIIMAGVAAVTLFTLWLNGVFLRCP